MGFKTKEKKLKDTEEKTIVIKTTLFTGTYGIELVTKIASKLAPTILPALQATEKKKISEIDINFKDISDNIAGNLLDGSMLELTKEILSSSIIGTYDLAQEGSFDIVFSGEYGLLIDSVAFVLEANYSSFLGGNITKKLTKLFQKVMEKPKKSLTK